MTGVRPEGQRVTGLGWQGQGLERHLVTAKIMPDTIEGTH